MPHSSCRSQAHDRTDIRVGLDGVDECVEEMVAKLTPERKPRHGAILHDAVGVERGHELPQGRVAVAILAYETADGALAQLVEVILQMADGAIDGAGQG